MKTVCIIPARGGSKGLKDKNILPLAGQPLITWPIRAAMQSGVIDNIFVSTDSIEITTAHLQLVLKSLFSRPEYAQDLSTTEDTLRVKKVLKNTWVSSLIYVYFLPPDILDHQRISEAVNALLQDETLESAFAFIKLLKTIGIKTNLVSGIDYCHG